MNIKKILRGQSSIHPESLGAPCPFLVALSGELLLSVSERVSVCGVCVCVSVCVCARARECVCVLCCCCPLIPALVLVRGSETHTYREQP